MLASTVPEHSDEVTRTLTSELESLRAKVAALEADKGQLMASWEKTAAISKENAALQVRVRALESLQTRVKVLEAEKAEAEALAAVPQRRESELLRARAEEVKSLQARVQTLEAKNRELERFKTSKAASETTEHEDLRAHVKELESLRARVAALEADNRDLEAFKEKAVAGNMQYEELRTRLKKLEPAQARIAALEAENKQLRASKTKVEPAPSTEVPSITVAEKSQSAPSRSTEPSPVQERKLPLTPESQRDGNSSSRSVVLEKPSITNRKSLTDLIVPAFAKLRNALTKSPTKRPSAPSQLETKTELGRSSLPSKAELAKAQTGVRVPTAKSDLGPTSLIPKLEELGTTQASIGAQVSKRRHPSSSALIGYTLAGLGGLSLIVSVIFTSTVLAFIGLGLTFWGALLLFIRPRYYVRTDLMDSTALSSLETIDRVITGLGYNEKGIYIPVGDPEKTVVFLSSQPLKEIPKAGEIENQTFVKDPEGITIVPPGMALANLFEEELGVKFNEWSLEKMTERLPKLLIEDLEMVQDCIIKVDGDNVSFRFVESVFSEFCDQLKGTTKVCSSLGCPMCSAMACILAQVTHRPVKFDEDKYTVDGATVESSYRLLTG